MAEPARTGCQVRHPIVTDEFQVVHCSSVARSARSRPETERREFNGLGLLRGAWRGKAAASARHRGAGGAGIYHLERRPAPSSRLELIRVGWNRRRPSTAPVTLISPFEGERGQVVRWNRAEVPPETDPFYNRCRCQGVLVKLTKQ